MKKKQSLPLLTGSIAAIIILLQAGAAPLAAAGSQPLPWNSSHKNPEVKKAYDEEFKTDVMKEPMYLPGLPLYTGKTKFLSGISFPKVKGGATVNMRFSTTDDADTVLNWYRGILSQKPWQMDRGGSVGRSLAARDSKGHIGAVTVFQSRRKGKEWHTEYIVIYKHSEN
jgi:hypothetical protein